MIFKRFSSWLLRHTWLKQPFHIEYPVISNESKLERTKLLHQLFNENPLTAFDYFKQENHSREEWDNLDYNQQLAYESLRVAHLPSFTCDKPLNATGIDLLALQTGITSKHNLQLKWNSLAEQDKQRLIDGPNINRLYEERLRVWKGYEIVSYLKQHVDKYRWNPYPILGLYPWEIIMDKLQSKKKLYEFEYDYYDVLIREAFERKYRKNWQIYYCDVEKNDMEKNDVEKNEADESEIKRMYKQLPVIERNYYDEKQKLRKQHTQLLSLQIKTLAFRNFFKTFDNEYDRPLLRAINRWNTMKLQWDDYKPTTRMTGRSRTHQYEVLYLNMSIVMDYIYYVGGVEGQPPGFNWLSDMKQVTKFPYMNKGYMEKIL